MIQEYNDSRSLKNQKVYYCRTSKFEPTNTSKNKIKKNL